MLRIISFTRVAACCAALSASALADTVTLKNGEKIEGKITAETETEITMDAKVSAGIIDSRTIKKSEVLSVSKDAPDEVAWQPLKNLKPGANSLPASSYDAIINPLKGFVSQFPKSSHAAEGQKLADAFAEEKKRVEAGEVKLDNKWLSKEEAQKERYQINGLVAFNYMRDQSTRDLVGALNSFDVIEKNFAGSRSYPDAVELAKRVLAALKVEVDKRAQAAAALKTERDKAIQLASGTQRTELMAIHQREQAAAEAALAAASKQGLRWPPMIAGSERSLQSISQRIPSELARLNSLPLAKMRESVKLAETAKTAFDKNDLAAADASVKQALDAWSANELANRLRQDVQTAKSTASAPPPPEIAPARPVAAAPAPTAPAADENAPAQAEPEKPFLLTPGGAVTVVIAVAFIVAALNAFKKIRAKANDVLE